MWGHGYTMIWQPPYPISTRGVRLCSLYPGFHTKFWKPQACLQPNLTKEKLYLQRYGEQSVRWQLCAPYRCKNKCLGGVCFYSDMEHKSNNMIKNDKIATQLWSFKFRNFLAKTMIIIVYPFWYHSMISKRSKYPFQDFFLSRP